MYFLYIIYIEIRDVFHLITQVDTNVILFFLVSKQNNTCVDMYY